MKEGWPEARALFNTLAALPPGQVGRSSTATTSTSARPGRAEHPRVRRPAHHGGAADRVVDERPVPFYNLKETSRPPPRRCRASYERFFDFPGRPGYLRLRGVRYYAFRRLPGRPGPVGGLRRRLGLQDEEVQMTAAAGLPVVQRSGPSSPSTRSAATWSRCPLQACWSTTPTGGPPGSPGTPTPEWLETPLVFASSGDPAARAAFADAGPLPLDLPAPGAAGPAGRAGRHDQRDRRRDQLPDRPRRRAPSSRSPGSPTGRSRARRGPWLSPALMVVVPPSPRSASATATPPSTWPARPTVVRVEALLAPTVVGFVRSRRRKAP